MKKPQANCDRNLVTVRAEIAAVLSSKTFVRAPGLAQFLSYICEKLLAGESDQIKEYTVGVEALGRGPDFDPKDDAIVRVEANRLRKRLQDYYESEGKDHAVRISLPPGSYTPIIHCLGSDTDGDGDDQSPSGLPTAQETPAITPDRIGRLAALARRLLSPTFVGIAAVLLLVAVGFIAITRQAGEARSTAASPAQPGASRGQEIRILAGSSFKSYLDRQGNTWLGDRYFTGGFARGRPDAPVFRTPDPDIYRYWREGDFSYEIPLKPGLYELRLHFAELVFGEDRPDGGGEGSRLVKVRVNGQPCLPAFDIISDAGGDSSAIVKVLTDISPASDGILHLEFRSNKANAIVSGIEIRPGLAGKMWPVRIWTRPSPCYDEDQMRWDADSYYRGGRAFSRLTSIKPTRNAALYQTERYGNFSYCIPVAPQGTYTINLKFCENYFREAPEGKGYGSRIFNVVCNGETLLRDFDIMQEAGGSQIPLDKSFKHLKPSAQGTFLISLVPVKNYASISAIEILPE